MNLRLAVVGIRYKINDDSMLMSSLAGAMP